MKRVDINAHLSNINIVLFITLIIGCVIFFKPCLNCVKCPDCQVQISKLDSINNIKDSIIASKLIEYKLLREKEQRLQEILKGKNIDINNINRKYNETRNRIRTLPLDSKIELLSRLLAKENNIGWGYIDSTFTIPIR